MFKSYLKIAFRNLSRNKSISFINIGGLAVGMTVAMLIGLWVYDELSFNNYHQNHDRIARVMQHSNSNGEIKTSREQSYVMSEEIRNNYGADFKYVLQASFPTSHILSIDENNYTQRGFYVEPQVTGMLSLKMVKGNSEGLKDPYSVLLSESAAKILFGNADPLDKSIKVNNYKVVKVTGVYEDIPHNSSFSDMQIMLPWELYLISRPWIRELEDPWDVSQSQTFVQLADNADLEKASLKIRDLKLKRINKYAAELIKPQVFLHPMNKWHLYEKFENGVNTGGRIEFVWLFGFIGLFVLILACINFMNLSTARSEKRAKEVGIRKAIGSVRRQLVTQFFSESLFVSLIAFIISLALVTLALPFFNEVTDKEISLAWSNPLFWLLGIAAVIITGLLAGLYPSFYLSSFNPVKVLKGTFRAGRYASIPRKALVVIQFTVSVTLIIGTVIIYRQVEYARNRPLGYNNDNLIRINLNSADIHNHFEAVRNELKNSGVVTEIAESGSPTTEIWNTNGGFDWEGKDPKLTVGFANNPITYEYGKTIGWQFVDGRDFSREFASDSAAFVMNEAAAKFIGFTNPVDRILKWNGRPFKIIGIVKDMVVESPYEPSRPAVFHLTNLPQSILLARQNPRVATSDAIAKIKTVFKKYSAGSPFQYQFVDEDYAKKFSNEERISTLATFFAILAIFISCLGLFGLASFVAEQRTKEIGIRKVVGASVFNLWKLLSKEFVFLVILSCFIAIPISWYYMNNWLQNYSYRTEINWYLYAAAIGGALFVTLLTVSFQTIKAAMTNPVKSLKTE